MGKHKKTKKKITAGFPNRGSVMAIVEKTARDICLSLGMRLAYVDSFQREDVIISVFIDKPGGVTLDDCVQVNRELGDVLDIELDVNVPYRLEVSSPGIDFIYPDCQELEKNVGNEVEVCVEDPGGKRKKTKGVLVSVSEESVSLKMGDSTTLFSINEIKTARITGNNGDTGC